MIRQEETTTTVRFASSVHPKIVTTHKGLAEVIAWADANPVVWKIVMGSRSAPFGKNASTYMGYQRGDSPTMALQRAATFKDELRGSGFFGWRARFTLAHYSDKGIKGGFFQQFDGTYTRGSSYLDYTPATLDEVIGEFLKWCDVGYRFPTCEVWLDKKPIRKFPDVAKWVP